MPFISWVTSTYLFQTFISFCNLNLCVLIIKRTNQEKSCKKIKNCENVRWLTEMKKESTIL